MVYVVLRLLLGLVGSRFVSSFMLVIIVCVVCSIGSVVSALVFLLSCILRLMSGLSFSMFSVWCCVGLVDW